MCVCVYFCISVTGSLSHNLIDIALKWHHLPSLIRNIGLDHYHNCIHSINCPWLELPRKRTHIRLCRLHCLFCLSNLQSGYTCRALPLQLPDRSSKAYKSIDQNELNETNCSRCLKRGLVQTSESSEDAWENLWCQLQQLQYLYRWLGITCSISSTIICGCSRIMQLPLLSRKWDRNWGLDGQGSGNRSRNLMWQTF